MLIPEIRLKAWDGILRPHPEAAQFKSLYFILGAAIGVFFTFINVYYRHLGLSGVQIGLIATLAPLCGAFSTTFWGLPYDLFGQIRLLLAIISGGALLTVLLLSQAHIFLLILLLAAVLNIFHAPIFPMLDSTIVRTLGARSADYGQYRA